jgi:hypothetical protein
LILSFFDLPSGGEFTNFLFRGNLPIIDHQFAYDALLSNMSSVADDHDIHFPEQVYLVVIRSLSLSALALSDYFSLLNPTEVADELYEIDWLKKHPSLGEVGSGADYCLFLWSCDFVNAKPCLCLSQICLFLRIQPPPWQGEWVSCCCANRRSLLQSSFVCASVHICLLQRLNHSLGACSEVMCHSVVRMVIRDRHIFTEAATPTIHLAAVSEPYFKPHLE